MLQNHELRTRCSKELDEIIQEFVDNRTYPSGDNYKVRIKFKSKAELVLFFMRAIAKSNLGEWDAIINWLHPDRKF